MTHWALVVIAGVGLLAGCGGRPVPKLADDPDEVVVLSIDGRPHRHEADEPLPEAAKVERVHGYPVLGQVAVGDPGQRREVVARVRQAIQGGPSQAARCFIPRHVVRVVKAGRSPTWWSASSAYGTGCTGTDKTNRARGELSPRVPSPTSTSY